MKVDLSRWYGEQVDQFNVITPFNLAGNAVVFTREGLSVVPAFDKLIKVSNESDLCFR